MDESAAIVAKVDLNGYAIMSSFARSEKSARFLSYLIRIDSLDFWSVDFNENEGPNVFEISAFIAKLQLFLNTGGMEKLHNAPREFLQLLGGLRSSRCLYLIKEVSIRNPVLAEQLTELIRDESETDLLITAVRKRLKASFKAEMLGEIFSNSRLEKIRSIMRTQNV